MLVTTSSRVTHQTRRRARGLARLAGFTLVDRRAWNREEPALVVARERLTIGWRDQVFGWHPGLLHTRLEAGWSHPLVRAMDLRPGDRVLDSSLGLGTDASFLSRLTGRTVVAIEAIPAVALMTAEGLRRAGEDVAVVHGHGVDLLSTLPDDSFDVVQGDPMFPPGDGVTHSLDVLRLVAFQEAPGERWLREARRVARRRVVIRDVWDGVLLESLGADEIIHVRRRRPRYGVWRSD